MNRQLSMPRCHWNKQHGKHIRAKRIFKTLQEAEEYIEKRNLKVQGYNAYMCNVGEPEGCYHYHIGHNHSN